MAGNLLPKQMQQWNSKVQFNQDNYIIRCTEAKFGPSKAGNPMITLEFEILSPETMNVAGVDYNIAGVKPRLFYLPTKVLKDGEVDVEATENKKVRCDEITTAFGLPAITDPDNPDTSGFKGKVLWAMIGSESQERRKSPTAEQAAKGEKGDVLTNPMTGEPVVTYFPNIIQFYGVPAQDVIEAAVKNKPF